MLLRAWLLYAPCRAGLLDVPVGGGPPASRPRREPSALRVDSKAGQAPPPPTGTAARPSDTLHTSGAWWLIGCSERRLVLHPGPRPNGTTARPDHHPVGLASLIAGSTTNFACNSHAIVSNYEFTALELQRFHTLLNLHQIELHAKFMEPGPATAASFDGGTIRRCSRF